MEIIAINRQLRSKAQRNSRCGTGNQTNAKERTAVPVADGFLRHRFSPVMEAMPGQLENRQEVERDFFSSLSNLQQLYGFEVEITDNLCYPCNIAAAWGEALYHMDSIAPNTGMAILQWGEGASIATYEVYNTGQCLYYVPLQPLWEMLQDKDNKAMAGVLLSLYAYLYQTIGVPDYTKDDYNLYYTYLRLAEWYRKDDEMEKEYRMELKAAIRLAKQGGKSIFRRICRKGHLKAFGRRLNAFCPKDEKQQQLKGLARSFYDLSLAYPERSIGQSLFVGLMEPDEEQRMLPDQYLSFIWDNNDVLADDLFESVNNDLSEVAVIDEPLALQFFDSPQLKPCHDLSFEDALFTLIDKLIGQLNHL